MNYLPTYTSRLVVQHPCQVSFKSMQGCRRSWEDMLKCVKILSVKDHNSAKICQTWIISPHALLDLGCNIPKMCKTGKTRWTWILSTDISPHGSVVALSPHKRKVPGSNPTVGMNFSFCNSRSTRILHTSSKPLQMKSTMTYTKPIPCFR